MRLRSIQIKKAWFILFWVNFFVILWYWWQGSSAELLSGASEGVLMALGRVMGLLAAFAILLQFLFIGRMPWLEKTFGLDKLSQIHHTSGKYGILFLLLHPVLLTFGYGILTRESFFDQAIIFITDYEHVWMAAIALVLFLIVVASSIYIVRSKMRYESWYFVHLVVYLAIFGSFWHQIELGTSILSSQLFYWYWIALYAVVLGLHLVFRFISPVYLFKKHQFRINRIVRENYNTVSIYISGKNLEEFDIKAGQFMVFRFLEKGYWWQAHPFSLSKMSDNKELRITVKELGDFTKSVSQLKPGTFVVIEGPYGVFTDVEDEKKSILLIAGGIGITPIRSLLEDMVAKGKQIKLLYCNRTTKDIVFKEEIEKICQNSSAEVIHILSDQPEFEGEKGRLDRVKIEQLVADASQREIYVCGPPAMSKSLLNIFKKMQIPMKQVHYEKFSL